MFHKSVSREGAISPTKRQLIQSRLYGSDVTKTGSLDGRIKGELSGYLIHA